MVANKKSKRTAREAVRRKSKAAYQELILEAAQRVFVDRGFAGTRMADVAAEAGVSTGTLYNYFGGKDEVLRSLKELRTQKFLEGLERAYEACPDPVERLRSLVGFAFEYLEDHRAMLTIMIEARATSPAQCQVGDDEHAEKDEAFAAVFERAIRELADGGHLRQPHAEPADLAAFVTGAMHGMARTWLASPEPGQLVAKGLFVADTFWRGVNKENGR